MPSRAVMFTRCAVTTMLVPDAFFILVNSVDLNMILEIRTVVIPVNTIILKTSASSKPFASRADIICSEPLIPAQGLARALAAQITTLPMGAVHAMRFEFAMMTSTRVECKVRVAVPRAERQRFFTELGEVHAMTVNVDGHDVKLSWWFVEM